jgi:hypothetical protein
MFYRCKKVQHKPINIQVRDQIQRSKETWVCWGTAHRTVRCTTGQCSVWQDRTAQTSHSRVFPGALRYNSPDCLVCHRTVRCTSGATATSRNGRLQKPLTLMNSAAESEAHRTVNRTCPVWHWTVRCHKRTSFPTIDWVKTLTVGWRGGAPDSVRCAHRQQPFPTACWWLRAINTPQPPQLQGSKYSEVFIQYKS